MVSEMWSNNNRTELIFEFQFLSFTQSHAFVFVSRSIFLCFIFLICNSYFISHIICLDIVITFIIIIFKLSSYFLISKGSLKQSCWWWLKCSSVRQLVCTCDPIKLWNSLNSGLIKSWCITLVKRWRQFSIESSGLVPPITQNAFGSSRKKFFNGLILLHHSITELCLLCFWEYRADSRVVEKKFLDTLTISINPNYCHK